MYFVRSIILLTRRRTFIHQIRKNFKYLPGTLRRIFRRHAIFPFERPYEIGIVVEPAFYAYFVDACPFLEQGLGFYQPFLQDEFVERIARVLAELSCQVVLAYIEFPRQCIRLRSLSRFLLIPLYYLAYFSLVCISTLPLMSCDSE